MDKKEEILIRPNAFWKDIQSSFSVYYPYLKIEIVENGLKTYRSSINDPSLRITPVSPPDEPCSIDVMGNRTVSQVISDFKTMLGLDLQVSRKSGKVWNVISITDGWTLKSQNAAGEFITAQPAIPANK